jgi:hypothetical protein
MTEEVRVSPKAEGIESEEQCRVSEQLRISVEKARQFAQIARASAQKARQLAQIAQASAEQRRLAAEKRFHRELD